MSQLHYRVTVEFDVEAEDPGQAATALERIRALGEVTKVQANKKVKVKE